MSSWKTYLTLLYIVACHLTVHIKQKEVESTRALILHIFKDNPVDHSEITEKVYFPEYCSICLLGRPI